MDAFTRAAATIAADPNLGTPAVYAPAIGAAVPCRVVLSRREPDPFSAGSPGRRTTGWEAMLPASALPAFRPARGETLTIGDIDYQIEEVAMDPISATYTLTLTLSGPDARGA
jgi:acyl-homoserine lactone acylase PvdQ